jgi:hypothetical protein
MRDKFSLNVDRSEPGLSVCANGREINPAMASPPKPLFSETGVARRAITKEEVAEAVRAWCNAWHTRDM